MSEVRRTAAEAAAPDNVIAFQGALGAYSDMACREARPQMTTLPCASFEDTFAAVRDGRARYAMIPIENSSAGRVADIHRSEEHTSELQSLMRISYAVFCLKKKQTIQSTSTTSHK